MRRYNRDPRYVKVMNSAEWQRTRAKAIARDKALCQDCLKKGRVESFAEVHHIEPLERIKDNARFFYQAYNLSNLVCLCKECHTQRHMSLGSHTKAERKRRDMATVDNFVTQFL